MTMIKTYGFVDTPIEGVPSLTFPRAVLNYGADFRVKSDNAGRELVLTNITSPVDRPEKIRMAYSEIANVFNGSGVEPTIYVPSKRGISLLSQVTNSITVTSDTDPSYLATYPVSAHLVLKAPMTEYITASDIEKILGRLISTLYDSGLLTTTRLEAMLRGSLAPLDV